MVEEIKNPPKRTKKREKKKKKTAKIKKMGRNTGDPLEEARSTKRGPEADYTPQCGRKGGPTRKEDPLFLRCNCNKCLPNLINGLTEHYTCSVGSFPLPLQDDH
eukprot:TRINITY_DN15287_c0_g1_i2.p1 TRINITY_DN15287_c0_g1~~TRINITY_DN15287_c0_g1_i2.p1  ORF type:complete len:104 (+),score=27.13 TRINITY_DN15287_c0_g1_i2:87-398(+)